MTLINSRRLIDYPRLMLFTTWLILGVNVLLHQGWIGAFGQVIGQDFIVFYKTGIVYRSDPSLIYDYDAQNAAQKSILDPNEIPSNNPFQNPPFVAPVYALLTYIPLPYSLLLWSIVAVLSVFLSSRWLIGLVPTELVKSGLDYKQLVIIILSFFPFIEGLIAGQNHWISLLLVTGILITTLKQRWYLSGMLAGLLLYKPQYVIGFLILWFVWGKLKALIGFGVIAISWIGLFSWVNGFELFRTYSQLSQAFLLEPYIPGWPGYLLITIYGLLTSIFPISQAPYLYTTTQILFVGAALGLAWFGFVLRKRPLEERVPALCAALIFPFLATPFSLLHDMVILIPGFILWARYSSSRNFLYLALLIYFGSFFLSFASALTEFSWVSLLTILTAMALIIWIASHKNHVLRSNSA